MREDLIESMKEDLSRWRSRMDEFRVKANLGRMEVRDKLHEFEKAYERAKERLSEWRQQGETEWEAASSALEKGWDSLRDTYHDVKKKHQGG